MLTRRLFAVAGLGVAAVLVAACGKQEAPAPKAEAKKEEPKKPDPVKIGFVYVSPIGEAGWTSQHNR
ncbi:MAG: BMP family ABC transporter substrate-binding protein, partial [Betaproteobacteria bacterium]